MDALPEDYEEFTKQGASKPPAALTTGGDKKHENETGTETETEAETERTRFFLFPCHPLHPGGTELELGDFADRIQRRVGEGVGGGFGVAEWPSM